MITTRTLIENEKLEQTEDLERGDILSKGRQALRVKARSLFCYIAVQKIKASVTDLARLLGMAPSAMQ
jgi:chromosomal replication initiation ATPase DnaA